MVDTGWWILDGGWTTCNRTSGSPIPGSQFPIPKSPCISDVCGRAKMYSFWDVFNFSLKSLSDVVRSFVGFLLFLYFSLFFSDPSAVLLALFPSPDSFVLAFVSCHLLPLPF